MLGRSSAKQIDDEPNWREKLADWRDSPPWVFERPDWMTEEPGTLLLLFGGLLCAILSLVYFAVPPATMPAAIPGSFSVAAAQKAWAATSSTSTSTTTTTVSHHEQLLMAKRLKTIAASPERTAEFWRWVQAVGDDLTQQAQAEAILSRPQPAPFRRWSYAFLTFALAGCLLTAAWFASDARGRRMWGS